MARLLKVSNGFFALESPCDGRTFILDYAYPGRTRKVKQQIVDMALNGSKVRDTARVLHVSPSTVIRELQKDRTLQQVKSSVLKQLNPEQAEVEVCLAKPPEKPDGLEYEMDEMWRSYFGKKDNPRWLWQDK